MNKAKINRIIYILLTLLLASGFTACHEEKHVDMPGDGITTCQWGDINDADINGETLIFEFDAPADWTAVSADEWCVLLTEKGCAGLSSLRIKVLPNDSNLGRSSSVAIQIEGYTDTHIVNIRQGEGYIEKGPGRYREVNKWIYDYMSTHYLWNDVIPMLMFDHSLDYDRFLTSMLDNIASVDEINREDGYWVNGVRKNYYSYIESNAPVSRAVGESRTDGGMMIQAASLTGKDKNYLGFAIVWVAPGSPAAEVNLKRGDFITAVNNTTITQDNYYTLSNMVLNGNANLDICDVEFNGGIATLKERGTILVSKYTYVQPAVYEAKMIDTGNGKKVAYLHYMGFFMDDDQKLINEFKKFKNAGAEELIIDLRYNSGGHVLSSVLLGTLVAGTPHKDEIYVRTTYNSARTAAGEVGEYRIGQSANPEMPSGYSKIADALKSSLDLDHVYVITSSVTASASEVLINGLRGLGITVNLIGTTTNGKNVGMEGVGTTINGYSYRFYPITFYCENALGFRDYSDGFKPDFEFDDSMYYPGNFGTADDALSAYALLWIANGAKPSAASKSRNNHLNQVNMLPLTDDMMKPITRQKGGSIIFPVR